MTEAEVHEQGKPGADELAERLREFVRAQLREGAEPCDLSFVLAYVATEMGLAIASNSVGVFPVVLEAVAKAAQIRVEAQPKPKKHGADEEAAPADRILH